MKTNKYTVSSLFTGIGGFDIGFGGTVIVPREAVSEEKFIKRDFDSRFVELKENNFDIVFQNDIDKNVERILEFNGIRHNFSNESIFNLVKNKYPFPKTDVILGGFPCQPFSHSGNRLGFENNKSHNNLDEVTSENNSGNLYKSFVEVVNMTKPKIFVGENVMGLLTMKGALDKILMDFSKVGYNVAYQLVDCTDFGIPQKRKRIIIIGIRKDYKGTLKNNWNCIEKNKIRCVLNNYLRHLQEPENTDDISQKLYSKAKKLKRGQGQNEINMNGFAPTIRSEHHGNIEFRRHTEEHMSGYIAKPRRLTVRECGLIQTFPPTFYFTDKCMSGPYKNIGNAVPPLLSYIIADKIYELLKIHF